MLTFDWDFQAKRGGQTVGNAVHENSVVYATIHALIQFRLCG